MWTADAGNIAPTDLPQPGETVNENVSFSAERTEEISKIINHRLRRYLNQNRDVNGVEYGEDLRQEAWIKILQAFRNGTEVTGAVVSKASDSAFGQWRKIQGRQDQGAEQLRFEDSVSNNDVEALKDTVAEPIVGPDQEFAVELAKITMKICNDERESAIALLSFYHQLSPSDIADRLEIPRDTVRSILFRLRIRAKDLMGLDIEVAR